MGSLIGVWSTWAEVLAIAVLVLALLILGFAKHAKRLREQGSPGKALKWEKRRRLTEVLSLLAGILILIAAFVTNAFGKDKPPPVWVVIVGVAGVAFGAAKIYIDYAQKQNEVHRAHEAWIQKIRALVLRWPLPQLHEVDPYIMLGVTESQVAKKYAKPDERPPYVVRDVESDLKTALMVSDFVLLVGHSKSGKSRTAFEVVLRLYPNQWLIVPSDGKSLVELFRLDPPVEWGVPPTIIWLDELQRFLGPNGLAPSLLNLLAQEKGRFKLLATLTSKRYDDYLCSTSDTDKDSQIVLQRFQQIHLKSDLSPEETKRAQAAYPEEPPEKLSASLGEYLVAARALVDKYEIGKESRPQGHALVQAAIDWRRVGILRPIPESALRELATQYLGLLKLPNVDLTPDAFAQGLQWARQPVGRHVALLAKVGEEGQERQFEPFDYLVDYVDRQSIPIPERAWDVILGLAWPSDALLIGRLAYRRRYRAIARKALEQAMSAENPEVTPSAAFALGVMFQDEHEIDDAERLYRTAIDSKNPDVAAMAMINLGKIFMDRGKLADAERLFREVIGSQQVDVARKATANLGVVYLKRGELVEAERLFREVVNSREADVVATAKVNLGRIFLDKGDFAEAERLFREVDRNQEEAAAMADNGIATIFWLQGRLADAERIFREVLGAEQTNVRYSDSIAVAASNLVSVLLSRGELTEAELLCQKLVKSRRVGVAAMAKVHLGVIYLRRRDLGEAERLFREAIDIKQSDAVAMAMANLGIIYQERNELVEAERLFREAIKLKQPDAADVANANLGRLFMDKGRLAEAELCIREVLKSKQVRAVAGAKVDLGVVHAKRNEMAKAELLFREAIEFRQPESTAMAMVNLGVIHASRGELLEADRLFREAATLNHPDSTAKARANLDIVRLKLIELLEANRPFDAAARSGLSGAAAMSNAHLEAASLERDVEPAGGLVNNSPDKKLEDS